MNKERLLKIAKSVESYEEGDEKKLKKSHDVSERVNSLVFDLFQDFNNMKDDAKEYEFSIYDMLSYVKDDAGIPAGLSSSFQWSLKSMKKKWKSIQSNYKKLEGEMNKLPK